MKFIVSLNILFPTIYKLIECTGIYTDSGFTSPFTDTEWAPAAKFPESSKSIKSPSFSQLQGSWAESRLHISWLIEQYPRSVTGLIIRIK